MTRCIVAERVQEGKIRELDLGILRTNSGSKTENPHAKRGDFRNLSDQAGGAADSETPLEGRAPKMAVPIRTIVAPSSIAC